MLSFDVKVLTKIVHIALPILSFDVARSELVPILIILEVKTGYNS